MLEARIQKGLLGMYMKTGRRKEMASYDQSLTETRSFLEYLRQPLKTPKQCKLISPMILFSV